MDLKFVDGIAVPRIGLRERNSELDGSNILGLDSKCLSLNPKAS